MLTGVEVDCAFGSHVAEGARLMPCTGRDGNGVSRPQHVDIVSNLLLKLSRCDVEHFITIDMTVIRSSLASVSGHLAKGLILRITESSGNRPNDTAPIVIVNLASVGKN